MIYSQSIERFKRHFSLEGFSSKEQIKLSKARVLVIGCGGLGHPILTYLAAAGIGYLRICDDDTVAVSNLNRQYLYTPKDVGASKTEVTKEFLKSFNPDIKIDSIKCRFAPYNYKEIISNVDLIIDGTDGITSKYFINDVSIESKIPLIHGAVTAYNGQIMVVNPFESACLRCLFKEIPPKGATPTCQQVGILGAACGIVGSYMAFEAIKSIIINGYLNEVGGIFYSLNLKCNKTTSFKTPKYAECDICGIAPTIEPSIESDYIF